MAQRAARQRLHRLVARGASGAARAWLLVRRAGRVRAPPARGRGYVDGAHPRARGAGVAEHGRRQGELRPHPIGRRTGPVQRRLPVRPAGSGPRGGRARFSVARQPVARGPSLRRPPGGFRFPPRARRAHPLHPAAGARPEHRGSRSCRRGARHPLGAAEPVQPGAARLRQEPASHPGDDHQPDPPHRRRDRVGQGRSRRHPLEARFTGSAAAHREVPGGRGAGGATHRFSRRGQAAQRQPRPRRVVEPHGRRARCHRLRPRQPVQS